MKINHYFYEYDLIYINKKGKQVLLNQKEVLDVLSQNKKKSRFVPEEIERGEEVAIKKLVTSLKNWLDSQSCEEEIQEDGTVKKRAGAETKDILSKLKEGDRSAVKRLKKNTIVNDKYKLQNFDLITWFLVNCE